MTLDRREFRNALGCFATGVTVVTALAPSGEAIGITVNSFSSLSLDPPLVLWCLDRKSATLPVFEEAAAFVVNVLDASAEAVSARLAYKGGHALHDIETVETELGPPGLLHALARFECRTQARHPGGDHLILVGRVVHFVSRDEGEPLLYFRGRYGALAPRG